MSLYTCVCESAGFILKATDFRSQICFCRSFCTLGCWSCSIFGGIKSIRKAQHTNSGMSTIRWNTVAFTSDNLHTEYTSRQCGIRCTWGGREVVNVMLRGFKPVPLCTFIETWEQNSPLKLFFLPHRQSCSFLSVKTKTKLLQRCVTTSYPQPTTQPAQVTVQTHAGLSCLWVSQVLLAMHHMGSTAVQQCRTQSAAERGHC